MCCSWVLMDQVAPSTERCAEHNAAPPGWGETLPSLMELRESLAARLRMAGVQHD
jgi:hypothetical protein